MKKGDLVRVTAKTFLAGKFLPGNKVGEVLAVKGNVVTVEGLKGVKTRWFKNELELVK